MDKKNLEPLSKKSQNDLMRKKLEAELRATEEIARIKQSVIEKRLAVELASLEQEQVAQEQEKSGDGKTDESRPSEEHPVGKKTSKVPVSPGEAEEGNRRWLKKFVTSSAKAESKEITADAATYSAFLDVPLKKSPFCGNRSVVATKHPIPITPMPEFFKALPGEEPVTENAEQHPKKRGFFLKDAFRKLSKRMKAEDRKKNAQDSQEPAADRNAGE